jgi:hypothetical protein
MNTNEVAGLRRAASVSQVLSPDGSCRRAVARVLACLVSRGKQPWTPRAFGGHQFRPHPRGWQEC